MREIRCTDGTLLYVAEPVPPPCLHESIELHAPSDPEERFHCRDCGQVLSDAWVELRLREIESRNEKMRYVRGNDGR